MLLPLVNLARNMVVYSLTLTQHRFKVYGCIPMFLRYFSNAYVLFAFPKARCQNPSKGSTLLTDFEGEPYGEGKNSGNGIDTFPEGVPTMNYMR